MRAPTDLPRRGRSPSARTALVVVASVVLLLIISLRGIAGFYTDFLWFDQLGQGGVWRGLLGTKVGLAVVFTLVFFGLMWANLAIADLLAPTFRPTGPEEQLVQRYHEVVGNRTALVRVLVSAFFALIAGPGAAGQWNAWVMFRNRVEFGSADAQFGHDIAFYVFQLPFLEFVVDWLFASGVLVLVVTGVAHYLNGGIRFQNPLQRVTPHVKAHLSVLLAFLALLRAFDYILQRFELLFSDRGVVNGAGYTDVNARLPALNLLVIISLFAFALLLVNILRRGWTLPIIAVGLWTLVAVVVGAAIPAAVQKFRVEPTESTKELPYIERNIAATRAAFNLDATQVDFGADDQLTAAELLDNEATIRNARLWDPAVILDTYKPLQEIRNFYRFNDVDVDRYDVDGLPTQMLVSVRELNPQGLPSASWVNRHLVYTHGYGAVATPASGVEGNGNPALRLKDLPPQGRPALNQQPSIYFGEGLGGYAVVDTQQREIDYTASDGTSHTTTYTGGGGVRMDSFLRRSALALRFGDINLLISSFIRPQSRALYVRDISERVRKVAPFLRYDSDPYPALVDGRVSWIYDAYTLTNRYPYSQRADTNRLRGASGLLADFNYVRNSVKVVIDAYTGEMTFYVVDPEDPIARAYQRAFPSLFTDGDAVPPELEAHFRYPEDLFRVQTNMFGLYHIGEPRDFYNKADAWDVAQAPDAAARSATLAPVDEGQAQTSRAERMDPYYLLMRLPDEQREEFLILQHFVPFSRDDSARILTAFMVAKNDRSLKVYVMPRNRQVDGPAIVNSRINSDPVFSEQRTLLGREGSAVELGNLLALPIEESLLWVQPVYVKAENTPLPQLKRVIAVFGERVEMRPSLQEALAAIFGTSPPTLEEQVGPRTTPAPPASPGAAPPAAPSAPGAPGAPGTVTDLLAQAAARFDAAQEAMRRDDLGAYQRETDAARDLVRRAAQAAGANAAPPPTTAPPAAPTTTAPTARMPA